ncbi:hypothetical protein COR50_20565 [Chitinophaga caeni]|uniref:RHS repeat-associated core domain-containing protein n=1 Tax=Chitinophaga caeni TaxID=2029983 RepID=A0A291QZK6_9BACT|nr:hypothetical protein COR50_20565 [Chitinophaga caeni]
MEYAYDVAGNRIFKKYTETGGTVHNTWYVRDASGNTLAVYGNTASDPSGVYWQEQHLYGSSRLGLVRPGVKLGSGVTVSTSWNTLGTKQFELTNHLGNVLAVISNKKLARGSGSTVDYYDAELLSATDYYPFGMQMPGRVFNGGGYRYGFNGKENDNEVKGEGNQQDYGMRVYDPRIGRFLSVDPISKSYPELTPYQFASNRPVDAIDIDGLEAYVLTQSFDGKGNIMSSSFVWNEGAAPVKNGQVHYIQRIVTSGSIKRISQVISATKINYRGGDLKPTPAPPGVLGTTNYYKWRDSDFNIRQTLMDDLWSWQPEAPDYYLDYGDKYVNRFTKQLRSKLSIAGKRWLDNALVNLQNAMESKLNSDPEIETDNKRFQKFAFDSHVDAYENAGLLDLPIQDLVLIGLTPGIGDLLSPNGLKQVRQVTRDYIQHAKEHPVSATLRVVEFMIHIYRKLKKDDE